MDRIRARLKKLQISEQEACRAGGLHKDTIRNIRRGAFRARKSGRPYSPTQRILEGLAVGLDCSIAYLLEKTDDPFVKRDTGDSGYTGSRDDSAAQALPSEGIDMINERLGLVADIGDLTNDEIPLVRQFIRQIKAMSGPDQPPRPPGARRDPQRRRGT